MKEKLNMFDKNSTKGITLIALVITIIVLLILAGVSIATLTGPNGLLTRANDAKTETGKAGAKEKVQMEVAGSYDNSGNLDKEMLNNNLENVEGLTGIPIESFPATVVVDGYEVTIDANGKVTVEGETTNPPTGNTAKPGEMVTGGNKEYTDETGTAVIPEGFAVVTNPDTIENGLVISDKPNDDLNNTAGGNQFVWIPVKTPDEYLRNTSYQDTNVSSKAYTDKGYLPEGVQPDLAETTDAEIGEKNEQAEREAVVKAGGFYISRYEAGKEGTDTLVSKKGATVWNNIAQEDTKITAKKMYNKTHVKSALCSGIQWDVVMKFVDGKNDGTGQVFDVETSSGTRHTSSEATSGQNEADRVCNIYDLEGNYWEYVAEKNTYNSDFSYRSSPYVGRGGIYYGNSQASNRGGSNGVASSDRSFRLALYVM